MTYISRKEVIERIPNKYEAIRVLALECRRLNEHFRQREMGVDGKLTSMAVGRLLNDEIEYYDARERREQERSEAMLSAAEGLLDPTEEIEEVVAEPVAKEAAEEVVAKEKAADSTEGVSEAAE